MNEQPAKSTVARHKTAIKRQSFSLPVKCLLRDGLLDSSRTFFDYGCGHGQDVAMLSDMAFGASGWDPVHRPDGQRKPADVLVTPFGHYGRVGIKTPAQTNKCWYIYPYGNQPNRSRITTDFIRAQDVPRDGGDAADQGRAPCRHSSQNSL